MCLSATSQMSYFCSKGASITFMFPLSPILSSD